jgi:hypothetical protein
MLREFSLERVVAVGWYGCLLENRDIFLATIEKKKGDN